MGVFISSLCAEPQTITSWWDSGMKTVLAIRVRLSGDPSILQMAVSKTRVQTCVKAPCRGMQETRSGLWGDGGAVCASSPSAERIKLWGVRYKILGCLGLFHQGGTWRILGFGKRKRRGEIMSIWENFFVEIWTHCYTLSGKSFGWDNGVRNCHVWSFSCVQPHPDNSQRHVATLVQGRLIPRSRWFWSETGRDDWSVMSTERGWWEGQPQIPGTSVHGREENRNKNHRMVG